ncbi:MAG: hypothetical protein OEY36_10145 [Gammaproteobacteria bacterium]|nr:hypothetical protein [Gammaproteobacteria bacterium]
MENYVVRVYRNEQDLLVARVRRVCDNKEFIIHNIIELAAVLGIENDIAITESHTKNG